MPVDGQKQQQHHIKDIPTVERHIYSNCRRILIMPCTRADEKSETSTAGIKAAISTAGRPKPIIELGGCYGYIPDALFSWLNLEPLTT
jgi:hypothetical protein